MAPDHPKLPDYPKYSYLQPQATSIWCQNYLILPQCEWPFSKFSHCFCPFRAILPRNGNFICQSLSNMPAKFEWVSSQGLRLLFQTEILFINKYLKHAVIVEKFKCSGEPYSGLNMGLTALSELYTFFPQTNKEFHDELLEKHHSNS